MKYLVLTALMSLSAMAANSMQCTGYAEIGEEFAGGYYIEFKIAPFPLAFSFLGFPLTCVDVLSNVVEKLLILQGSIVAARN